MKVLKFNNPLSTDPVVNCISFVTLEDAINFTRIVHPNEDMTDEEALEEFKIINWAWYVDVPEDFFWSSNES